MPKHLKADYASAKALFLTGLPLPDIAEKTGINYGALRQHARRHNWVQNKGDIETIIEKHVATSIEDAAKRYIERSIKLDSRVFSALEAKRIEAMELEELEKVATIMAKVNPVARSNRGLDDDKHKTIHVGLTQNVVEIKLPAAQVEEHNTEVIDVETVREASK